MKTATATTIATNTATGRSRRLRSLVVLAAVVGGLLASTLPATADEAPRRIQPADQHGDVEDGGQGNDDPGDEPDPSVLVSGTPRCEPEPGVDFDVTLTDGPARPHVLTFHWENVDTGQSGSAGASGSVDTGEGSVHLTGAVLYPLFPVVVNGQIVGFLPELSADHEILVDVTCPGDDDGDDGDDGDDDPGDDPVDPDVRSATPNFTG